MHWSGVDSGSPREFRVEPSSGVLAPKSELTFNVSLCPNSIAQYFRQFAVRFDEVANETYTVPITAQYAHFTLFTKCQQNSMICRCPVLAVVVASVCPSVRPSVCLSVTLCEFIVTAQV